MWQNIKRNLPTALMGMIPGIYILLIASKVIPVEAHALSVPFWFLFIIGGIFFLAGVSVLGVGVFSVVSRNSIGALIIGAFYITALWIAVGPGERVFAGVDPLIGRTAFGISALLVFFMLVIALRTIAATVSSITLSFMVSIGTILLVGYWWL